MFMHIGIVIGFLLGNGLGLAGRADWPFLHTIAAVANVNKMKVFMLIGIVIGFLLGIGLGLAGRADWPSIFLHATVAAATLGWLMKWWGGVWLRGLQTSCEQRRMAEVAARQHSHSTSAQHK